MEEQRILTWRACSAVFSRSCARSVWQTEIFSVPRPALHSTIALAPLVRTGKISCILHTSFSILLCFQCLLGSADQLCCRARRSDSFPLFFSCKSETAVDQDLRVARFENMNNEDINEVTETNLRARGFQVDLQSLVRLHLSEQFA